MNMVGMNDLLAGQAHGRFLAGVTMHHMGFGVAVQIQPAAHVMVFHEMLGHGVFIDQHLDAADDALALDARFEQQHLQVGLQLLHPVLRGDANGHGLGEVMNAEHHVPHRGILHQLRRQLEGVGVFDDGLDLNARVDARQPGGQVPDFRRTVGLPGLGQHDHMDMFGQGVDH